MYCMLHIFLTLLCAIIVAAQGPNSITYSVCGENKEYKCGSACFPTCDDLQYPQKLPKLCLGPCTSGCYCKEGFYQEDDGSCVAPDQCCAENEKYKHCGSSCIETCDAKPTMICSKRCVKGCFCACSDYVRQHNRTGSPCIHRTKCPEPCRGDGCPIMSFF